MFIYRIALVLIWAIFTAPFALGDCPDRKAVKAARPLTNWSKPTPAKANGLISKAHWTPLNVTGSVNSDEKSTTVAGLNSWEQFRWMTDEKSKKTYLENRDMGRDFYAPPIELSNCKTRTNANFKLVDCGPAKVLYSGSDVLFLSLEEYGISEVTLMNKTGSVKDALLVRVGVKSGSVVYSITKVSGTWTATECSRNIRMLD